VQINLKGAEMPFRLLIEKYQFMKAFNTTIDYNELYCDEIQSLLMVHGRIKEVENQCEEMINNAKSRS